MKARAEQILVLVILALALLIATCPAWGQVKEVTTDSAMIAFALDLRSHFTDHETVLCGYGYVQNDTAHLVFVRPAHILQSTVSTVAYDNCPIPRADKFGVLRYLGTLHNHSSDSLPNGGCYESTVDAQSFRAETYALADMIICKGQIWVVKR